MFIILISLCYGSFTLEGKFFLSLILDKFSTVFTCGMLFVYTLDKFKTSSDITVAIVCCDEALRLLFSYCICL